MSTNSTIGIIVDGKCHSIYAHWDGYPSYMGKLLQEHYSEEETVLEMIALGSVSCLKPRLSPIDPKKHDFNNPEDNTSIFYARDRGEKLQVQIFDTDTEMFNSVGVEHYYVMKDGVWLYASDETVNGNPVWRLLEDELAESVD